MTAKKANKFFRYASAGYDTISNSWAVEAVLSWVNVKNYLTTPGTQGDCGKDSAVGLVHTCFCRRYKKIVGFLMSEYSSHLSSIVQALTSGVHITYKDKYSYTTFVHLRDTIDVGINA